MNHNWNWRRPGNWIFPVNWTSSIKIHHNFITYNASKGVEISQSSLFDKSSELVYVLLRIISLLLLHKEVWMVNEGVWGGDWSQNSILCCSNFREVWCEITFQSILIPFFSTVEMFARVSFKWMIFLVLNVWVYCQETRWNPVLKCHCLLSNSLFWFSTIL